jgi:hypothetical protein
MTIHRNGHASTSKGKHPPSGQFRLTGSGWPVQSFVVLEEDAGALAGVELVDPAPDAEPLEEELPEEEPPEEELPEEELPESLLLELEDSVEEDGVVEEDAPRLSFL